MFARLENGVTTQTLTAALLLCSAGRTFLSQRPCNQLSRRLLAAEQPGLGAIKIGTGTMEETHFKAYLYSDGIQKPLKEGSDIRIINGNKDFILGRVIKYRPGKYRINGHIEIISQHRNKLAELTKTNVSEIGIFLFRDDRDTGKYDDDQLTLVKMARSSLASSAYKARKNAKAIAEAKAAQQRKEQEKKPQKKLPEMITGYLAQPGPMKIDDLVYMYSETGDLMVRGLIETINEGNSRSVVTGTVKAYTKHAGEYIKMGYTGYTAKFTYNDDNSKGGKLELFDQSFAKTKEEQHKAHLENM